MTDKYKAVATLLLTPKEVAEYAAGAFRANKEVDSLLALGFGDIKDRRKLKKIIPEYKIRNAQKIYANSRVHRNYLFKHLLHRRKKICDSLAEIPSSHKLICQVEVPTKKNKKYKNIDVGFTSNGKLESRDSSLMECSIRETWEEARIKLHERHYCPAYQTQKRNELGMHSLPLCFSYGPVFCYILVL